jgi:hypothetical protein
MRRNSVAGISLSMLAAAVLLTSASDGAAQNNGRDSPTSPTHLRFELTNSGGGLGLNIDEDVAFFAVPQGSSTRWILERSFTEKNWCGRRSGGHCAQTQTSTHGWADELTCPAIAKVMKRFGRARAADRDSAHPLVTDTPLLSLVTIRNGLMETDRLAEYEGPLVDWWALAEQQLKPCWTQMRAT